MTIEIENEGNSTPKKLRVLLAQTTDPYFNLATEDWIYRDLDLTSTVLFVWRNANTIVIGRGQNAWSECELSKVQADGVNLVRRHSGGGAVFQDLGNTCFTFLTARQAGVTPKALYARNNEILLGALRRMGIEAEASGRNDLVIIRDGQPYKISGSAFKESPDRCFHHGTMLINVDLGRLGVYLTPNQKKLKAKGIKSVQSRVMNLIELLPDVGHDSFTQALIAEFFSYHDSSCPIETLDHQSLSTIPTLASYYETLKSWDWVYGKTPSFQHSMDHRFPWGMVELHLDTERGHIKEVQIFSDALDLEFIEAVPTLLTGRPYTAEGYQSALSLALIERPQNSEQAQEFFAWVLDQL